MNGYCVALGFFDCVHRGHRKVLDTSINVADANGLFPAAVTFDDQSLGLLNKTQIYNFSTRKAIMRDMGIRKIFSFCFDEQLKRMSARQFLSLLVSYNVKHFVFGEDYTCGYDRKDSKQVSELCLSMGASVTIVKLLEQNGSKISSSEIEKALKCGQIEYANKLLGSPYFVRGEVMHGREVGRTMGFPTANVRTNGILLLSGVYKTITAFDGKKYNGLTNVGGKPTFDIQSPTVENTLIGFSGNLYGKVIEVEFIKFIRPIVKFNNINELKSQIQKDMEDARC